MGQAIVKLGEKYLIWSTVVDAPVTFGMTRSELTEWVRDEGGRSALDALPERLARADEHGTSWHDPQSAEETIWLNRAGKGETCLSMRQIIDHYVNGRGESDPPVGVKIDERFTFEQWKALP